MRLDVNLYEDVEHDRSALGQSLTVIILSSIAAGIGSFNVMQPYQIVINILAALLGWLLWAYITMIIGSKLLPEPTTEVTYGQMIRTTGFASSPGLLRLFGFIPFIGPIIFIVAQIWMLLAMIIAVKQALDYQNRVRPFVVSIIGWLVQFLLVYTVANLLFQRASQGM